MNNEKFLRDLMDKLEKAKEETDSDTKETKDSEGYTEEERMAKRPLHEIAR